MPTVLCASSRPAGAGGRCWVASDPISQPTEALDLVGQRHRRIDGLKLALEVEQVRTVPRQEAVEPARLIQAGLDLMRRGSRWRSKRSKATRPRPPPCCE
jgi:hypothetical protein